MRKHVNDAFFSMMTRLERKYAEQGHGALPAGMSEHEKINALAPRHLGSLCGHAHKLRIWRNATQHEREQWKDPSSDAEVEAVVLAVMSELERLDW